MICARCAHVWMRRAALSLSLLVAALLPGAPAAWADGLRVGFGRAEFPRPENGPLGGYGGLRDRRAQQLLDPPEARALVIEENGARVALVSLDLVIVRPTLREGLQQLAEAFALDTLVVAATHTHSGPGGYIPGRLPARFSTGKFEPGTARNLVRTALRALQLALTDLTSARAASGHVELSLARNRRFPDGPHETDLPLLRFDFPSGRAPVALFAYGAHPTVLSPKSRAYSADYVGAARAWLEQKGWRALFLAGPLGDQEPSSQLGELWPRDVAKQRAQVAEIGSKLGEAVLRGVRQLMPTDGAVLASVERWVEAPGTPGLRRFCSMWWFTPFVRPGLRGFLSRRVPIHAIRVGHARIVTLPAEPASSVAQEIRAGLPPGLPLFIIAHAGDWLGYVVSAEAYRKGGYEACMSFYGPELGQWLVTEALTTLRLLESHALTPYDRQP